MTNSRILIVDDEPDMRFVIRGVFEDEPFEIREAGSGEEALDIMREFAPDVLLTDIAMPGMDGQALLRACQGLDRDLPVILISALEDIEVVVDSMKDGAFDYMVKPFDRERLLVATRRAAEQCRLRREVAELRNRLAHDSVHFGPSQRAQELDHTLQLVAQQSGVAVLLMGESGTGKEVAAREIHHRSPVHDGPFVAIDCGALPEQLMESQLFGHKKGAFTGADRDRAGLFRMANGGTIFLDELGNLPPALQAKLLRALQERVVVPVGGGDPEPFDARLISATNANLLEAVERGEFRLDLYHRVNEFSVVLPPLRERPDDVRYFTELFLEEANRDMGRRVEAVTEAAATALAAHPWPGNLRELRNAIRRAMVVCSGRELDLADLEPGSAEAPATQPYLVAADDLSLKERIQQATDSLEAEIIRVAIEQADGNKAAAARALQIDYTTLHRKLKKHGLLTMARKP